MTTPATDRPAGFVHVDLDGLWTLAQVYGFAEGDLFARDEVWHSGLTRLLDLFASLDIEATFFLVGRDLELPAKRERAAEIVAAGHELANHSFSHRIDLEQLGESALENDYGRTQQLLSEIAGREPLGARAPGYAAGPRTRAILSRLGLRYDGSVLDTPWTPLLRHMAGQVRKQVRDRLSESERTEDSMALDAWYGRPAGGHGRRPWWDVPEGGSAPLLRIPVSVSPALRLPIHASLGVALGQARIRRALRRLARCDAPLCYLLHGLDALGVEDLQGLLPAALVDHRAFARPRQVKLDFLRGILGELNSVTRIQRTDRWLEGGLAPPGP